MLAGETAHDWRDERIGQILNDFLDRRARGANVTEADLLAMYPDLQADLCEHLELLRDLRPATSQIDALLTQGLLQRCDEPGYLARLGPYKVLEYIGRGGMGIVLRARDESLARDVALKILRPELADDALALARFVREARAAAGLDDPRVVGIYGVGSEMGARYIAMEFVAGTSLAMRLTREGPLPAEEARRIVREVLEGLAAAHAAGLIHRDIKSSNILLTKSEAHVKLVDFGLARMRASRTRLTATQAIVGTPEYMSPEQSRGEDSTLDERTDLYAAGVVFYEMLTGVTPFRSDSPTATAHRILYEEPLPPMQLKRDADAQLARVALRLLEKRPEDRFASATEALAALAADTRVRLPAERRRHMRRLALAAGGAALLAGVGGWQGNATANSSAEPRPTAASIDRQDERTLLVRYGRESTFKTLHRFDADAGRIMAATVVAMPGTAAPVVVAGTEFPMDGAAVFAFDGTGAELWRTDLSRAVRWPDCGPTMKVYCDELLAADLDGQPGQELLAIGKDLFEYPCCVALLDPASGAVRQSFWHTGHLWQMRIVRDYFPDHRPAIAVSGMNNKLDGFAQPRDTDPSPLTQYDIVSVAMILDPLQMGGLGPPFTTRVPGLTAAKPHAYAFLDRPVGTRDSGDRLDVFAISRFLPAAYATNTHTAPWLALYLQREAPLPAPGILTLDRELNAVDFTLSTGERFATSLAYWKSCWHPLYQHGQATRYLPTVQETLATGDELRGKRIRRAEVDPRDSHRVLVEYEGGRSAFEFVRYDVCVGGVAVADGPVGAEQLVIVGLAEPPRAGGAVLAYTPDGQLRWRQDLSDARQWPDCAPPTRWVCRALTAGDIDGVAGDEVLVSGGDFFEYPTRVSRLNRETGAIEESFWHFGHVGGLKLVSDFLGPGRPALLCWGVNNKLNGFRVPRTDDPAPVATHEIVPILAVLDPLRFSGVGPPAAARMPGLPVGQPIAYACLDMAISPSSLIHGGLQDPSADKALMEVGAFGEVAVAPYEMRVAGVPWVTITVTRPSTLEGVVNRALLTVDRELQVQQVVVVTGEPRESTPAFWRSRWHVLTPSDEVDVGFGQTALRSRADAGPD